MVLLLGEDASSIGSMFKETGHQNAYFPLFVPKSLFEAEERMQKGLQKNVLLLRITGYKTTHYMQGNLE